MDSISLASYFYKKLNQYEEGHMDYLSSGAIKDMEEYKFVMGELSMLRTLRQDIKEALHIEPSGWRLLVLPYKGKGVTDGGIQLLESTMDKENLSTSVCYVLKVGPLAYQDESKFNGIPWCEKGDWVLIGKYSGARFQLEDNHDVRIINDDEVIGTIADPNDIKSA